METDSPCGGTCVMSTSHVRDQEHLLWHKRAYAATWRLDPSAFDRPWAELSGGEAQRVALALALATQPQVLLLDEAISGLDVATQKLVEASLAASRVPIVMVTHSPEQLRRFCTHHLDLTPEEKRASGEEVLSHDTFRDVSLREGLCRGFHECQLLFGHFAQGRSAVPVNDLAALVLGNLDAKRQQVVLEVWSKLDPEGLGKVPVWQLLRHFDVRRLPDVRFGREDVEGARQKLLEGLGVVQCRAADRAAEFDLEEAAARRRPAPIGLPGGGPVVAPAGRAGIRARDFEDAKRELLSRGEAIDPEAVVSFEAWQAYFMAVSVGVLDDDVFALTLRDPLRTFEVHGKAHAQRLVMEVPEKHRPCNLRLLGTFADGSRQALTLRDDSGLEHLSGNAGCGDGQFWTWGPKVRDEIIRRFKAEGYEGLQTVSLRPF
ncbi:STAR1 [Symbiodinium sp. CCMP2592]|nr:STAR1 [Symbiodinium sp. CCMP2592]